MWHPRQRFTAVMKMCTFIFAGLDMFSDLIVGENIDAAVGIVRAFQD